MEQQLYIGKSIVQAIEDVAGDDTDGDGFTNGDELATYRTLPGYSCANYSIAQDPPADFQSLITPGVPSCLEPKDIKLDPTVISFVTTIGDTSTATLQLINNGSDFPIEVTDVSLLPDAPPSLTIDVPPLPLSIPVGQSVPSRTRRRSMSTPASAPTRPACSAASSRRADPHCLGAAAVQIGTDLVDTVFGTD